ncbi:NAD(P)H-dependent oxidoreductase, partial [Acinetobacter baumannii]
MLVYIVVGSVREGRTAIKIANWVESTIPTLGLKDFQTEVVDLKEWDLPLFSGSHPPATGIYDQPKQQEWANKIAQADAFIFISPEYNHG